ncbi:hypothetical protein MSG28_012783 [Choristoneura fumiferana]|uniref:Uncharacterized protein n=1 Tax=Choristoneura fumiferana TaxID=7141 RepID=A0ACC0JI33_CHOFU|nr:hypothetical protein MSG28_012783 [Choristoneura fumiferana]
MPVPSKRTYIGWDDDEEFRKALMLEFRLELKTICFVFDYDWGLQDDFMGSCHLDLTALELGRTQDLVLCLRDPNKPQLDMGEIVLNLTLWPKSQEDKDQLHKRRDDLLEENGTTNTIRELKREGTLKLICDNSSALFRWPHAACGDRKSVKNTVIGRIRRATAATALIWPPQ